MFGHSGQIALSQHYERLVHSRVPLAKLRDIEMTTESNTRTRLARWMTYGFWLALFGGLTLIADRYLEHSYNPNQHLSTERDGGPAEVLLTRNRFGHYVAPGSINGVPVVFLLDTGATSLSIPAKVAAKMNLVPRGQSRVSTANGTVTVDNVLLDEVALGNITLTRINAHINPYMEGETVLLGMSFMKHLEMTQKGDTLRLRL